jgi:hypothetical protein
MLHTVQQHISPAKTQASGGLTKQVKGSKHWVAGLADPNHGLSQPNATGQVDQMHAPREKWNKVTTKKVKNAGPFAHERSQGYATSVEMGALSSIPRASAVHSTEQPTATVTRNVSGFINKSPGISETGVAKTVAASDSVPVSPVTSAVTSGGASLNGKGDVCCVRSTLNPHAKEFTPA